ncbi:hypothetical protein [Clostridioides sp. ZZV15-6383]
MIDITINHIRNCLKMATKGANGENSIMKYKYGWRSRIMIA